jgi:two-component system, cell cycle sensor histidine kinase and response regulator CckA
VRTEVSGRRGHETILLVEDEESVRKLARLALERSGYTVLSAEHGLAALQVADAYPEHIDLLVSDVVMPGMRGPDLAHVLSGRRPGLKVLFISGYVQDAIDRADVSEANFLLKPFSLKDLAARVRDVLDAL